MKSTFSCPVCDRKFESLSDLMKHAKISHTEHDIVKSTKSSDYRARVALA